MRNIDKMYSLYGVEDGKKCGTCNHLIRQDYRGKVYYKCGLYGDSCSASTDFRLSYDACGMHNKKRDPRQDKPIVKMRMQDEEDDQIAGQMDIFDFI